LFETTCQPRSSSGRFGKRQAPFQTMRTLLDALAAAAAVLGIVLLFPVGILLIGLPVVLVARLILEIARRL
jgi:hypothetical protein